MKKIISVVLPVYNSSQTVVKALNSVKNQTFGSKNFEIIIVNDGSTDESLNIVEKYKAENPTLNISIFSQKNGGVSSARNTALKIAEGDYIALLDADDEWLPTKIEKQINLLENKELHIDFLSVKRTNQKILYPYKVKDRLAEITFRKLLIRNEAQPSTVVFKRKVLENTGLFNETQRYAEDINYWLKVSLNNKMFILDEELLLAGEGKRTFGISGLSANLSEMEKGFHRNLKEMFEMKKLSPIEYQLYRIFYRIKYIIRISRNKFLKLQGK